MNIDAHTELLRNCIAGRSFFISGAAGFIGSHLSEYLLEAGAARVWGVDNFLTGTRDNLKALEPFGERFEFHEVDITDGGFLEQLKHLGDKCDFVLNLASPASPIDFKKLSLEIMKVNSTGTWHMLELAHLWKATFLEASTSEVYGDPEVHPQPETYHGSVNTIGPRSCYDESKRFSEALTMSMREKFQIDTRIVRIFNTYGPRMRADDGRVVPNFINQALKSAPLTIYGNGEQTRSFCYVTDLVRALLTVLFKGDQRPCNIGNPGEYTVKELAQQILELVPLEKGKGRSELSYEPITGDDPKRRKPVLERLYGLGYPPEQISLKEGLKKTVDYFSEASSWK